MFENLQSSIHGGLEGWMLAVIREQLWALLKACDVRFMEAWNAVQQTRSALGEVGGFLMPLSITIGMSCFSPPARHPVQNT